ncbi:MAG: hypothetical protein R8F89_09290 [Roseobacter sp.]|nr:hypothetical protein [Roseobacter sp.]MDW3182169.1 hypothetical protein [Roseobacter sp.]
MVHLKTLSDQQDAKPPIPEPATLIRQFAQPLAQGLIALILLLVLENRPMKISQFTRPILRATSVFVTIAGRFAIIFAPALYGLVRP